VIFGKATVDEALATAAGQVDELAGQS